MKKQTSYILLILIITAAIPVQVFAFTGEDTISGAFIQFGAWVFSFAALLFQFAIKFLVFDIGSHMTSELGVVVNTVWTIMRDLCNLIFIFMFLLVGFRLVLTIENPAGAKKVLVPLLVAAALVNFSMFFAKAFIDIANVAAVAVYGLFTPSAGGEVDIAGSVAGSLGLNSYFNHESFGPDAFLSMTIEKGFMMMLFFLIASVAFFTASIALVKRYLVLLLGMIVSPIVLVFRLVPNVPFLSSVSKKAQDGIGTFIQSAFFPAVFLFLIYLTIRIVGAYAGQPEFGEALMDNKADSVQTIIIYIIGIALLFVSIKSASMISDSAANMAMSATRKAAGAATLGAAAFAGRQTLGRAGRALQEGKAGEALRTSSINRTRLGRLVTTSALTGAEKMRTASYEARNTKTYQRAAAAAGVPTGGGWGIRNQGFEGIREAEVKKEKETAERQAAILAGVNKTEQEEKEKKAKDEFDKTREALRDASSYRKIIEERNKAAGKSVTKIQMDELRDADKAVTDALLKQRKAKEEHEKVKNEYKEKVESVLVGTKEARKDIQREEAAAKLPAAETERASLIRQREDLVSRMATEPPEKRVQMQSSINEIDKKVQEQEKVIETAHVAAENAVSTEYEKAGADTKNKITATQTALGGVDVGSKQHAALTAELQGLQKEREGYLKDKYAEKRIQYAEQLGDDTAVKAREDALVQRESKRDSDVAQRLRDAAKAARNMKRKQGGIAGSLETEITVRDTARAAARGSTLGRVDIGSSAGREAGSELRDKNKPKA